MKLGFFTMPVHPIGRNYVETLREDREAFILADRLGYSEGLVGEHLTDRAENIPNGLTFLASLVDATRRITLGTAVVNLPYSHPVLVASNAAMLDTLLEGRFILGVGAGILRSDAEAMGILEQDRQAMFSEAVGHILALWAGEPPYDLRGKYWTISTERTLWPELGLGAVVRPYRKPHPPILGTAADVDSQTMVAIGRHGWWPASSGFLHANWLAGHWANYVKGCAEGGHQPDRSDWRIARTIFVADDEPTATAYAKTGANSPYRFHMRQLSEKLRKARRLHCLKHSADVADEAVTLDYVMDQLVIAGGVNSVVDQILALREKAGAFGTLLYVGTDWADPELSRNSMRLMAEKVMPAVNAALRSSVSTAAQA